MILASLTPDDWNKVTAIAAIVASFAAVASVVVTMFAVRHGDRNARKQVEEANRAAKESLRQAEDSAAEQLHFQRETSEKQVALAKESFEQQRLSVGGEWLLKLEEQWNGDDFCEERAKAARALSEGHSSDHVENVFDFFDTVGLLVRRGLLDVEMVWSVFFYWLNRYAEAGKSILEDETHEDPEQWRDFRELWEVLRAFETTKNANTSELDLSDDDLKQFYEEELRLLEKPKRR